METYVVLLPEHLFSIPQPDIALFSSEAGVRMFIHYSVATSHLLHFEFLNLKLPRIRLELRSHLLTHFVLFVALSTTVTYFFYFTIPKHQSLVAVLARFSILNHSASRPLDEKLNVVYDQQLVHTSVGVLVIDQATVPTLDFTPFLHYSDISILRFGLSNRCYPNIVISKYE